MEKPKKFFKDVMFYSGSSLFSNTINFIISIVVRRVLQPMLMGVFNEIMLIVDYARYSHLGVIDSLDRELPYSYGKKDFERVALLKNIGFSLCVTIALLVSAGLFIASFFIKPDSNQLLIDGMRVVPFIIIFQVISSLFIVFNRSHNKFSIISRYTILIAVLDLGAKVFLVIKFGLYGLLWASVLTLGLGLLYFSTASREKLKFALKFPFAEVKHLFKVGFPIFILGFVFMTLRNIDRIMIIRFLGVENLGFYTIALMASVYMLQLPNLVYAVVFPRFYQAYGERQNIYKIKDIFLKPTLVFAYSFPILAGCIIIFLPLLVKYLLPAYTPGLIPAYILLLGCSFLVLINMSNYLMIALNKQIYMVAIGIVCILIAVALNYTAVTKFNLGLCGIAIGTSLAHFTYATVLMIFAFRNYTKKLSSHFKFLTQLYVPIIWVAALLFILRVFTSDVSGVLSKDFLTASFKASIFLSGCLPLLFYVNRRTNIFTLLKQNWFKRK